MANELGLGDYGSDEEEEEEEQAHERLGQDGSAAAPLGVQENGGAPEAPNLFSAAPDISLTPPQSTMGAEQGRPGGDQEDPQGAGQLSTASADSNNVWNQLPPELRAAPPGSCSPAVEAKLLNIIATSRRQNRSFIDSLRKHRQYSNPDLLQQLVKIYNLKEAGSSFPQDVFSLDALPKEDSSDQLLRQLDRLQETRRQQRAEAKPGQASIPFERGTGSLGTLPPSTAVPGAQKGSAPAPPGLVGNHVVQLREQAERNVAEIMKRERAKRSKWDSAK
ncbi:hypothetical protein DUNSADRAFT_18402 [Dunaliella salina]|uniref:Uncharacterized protein n=1 Tax=Dunaliella salina TaxID=3046 RepID=A0ABQ7GZ31_DUNSA|nr:hypothetical protein DUNSADRAFT_18402 [Dunaliella salina]|eukprot:KAF5839859.1 hypothetical protein DUNSADRAFT_18402 [Dunaliella salina]